MQCGCTAGLRVVTDWVALECPVSLGENFENVGFGGFSKMRTIFFWGDWLGTGKRLDSL